MRCSIETVTFSCNRYGLPVLSVVLGALVTSLAAAPGAQPTAPSDASSASFEEVARQIRVDFEHDAGARGELLFPEIMGAGVALFDYDGDRDLDLFFVQGGPLRGTPVVGGDRLLRNDLVVDKDGEATLRFVDVTTESGVRSIGHGIGVAVGDVDGDGWPDIFTTRYGPDQLWRNNGDGTFVDQSAAAGVSGDGSWSSGAAFVDFDRDGDLDLFVNRYVDYQLANPPRCVTDRAERDYCGPTAVPPLSDRLFENRGNGTFKDVSLAAGIAALSGAGLGVIALDFDADGWLDFVVSNDQMDNYAFRNRGDGSFEDEALWRGLAVNGRGRAEASMGIAVGDVDQDGRFDLLMSHLKGETHTLYRNDGETFSDETDRRGLASPSLALTGFGVAFVDVDSDRDLDLVATHGAVRRLEVNEAGSGSHFAQPDFVLTNDGRGHFVSAPDALASDSGPHAGRGLAVGDLDQDGDPDVVISNNDGPAEVYLNRAEAPHWIGIELRAPGAYREAAVVTAHGEGFRLKSRSARHGSFASASDPRVLFGLGDGKGPVAIDVLWTDGKRESYGPFEAGRYHLVVRGTGAQGDDAFPVSARERSSVEVTPQRDGPVVQDRPIAETTSVWPDLTATEPEVRELLLEWRSRVEALPEDEAPALLSPRAKRERVAVFGEAGRRFLAHRYFETAAWLLERAASIEREESGWWNLLAHAASGSGDLDRAIEANARLLEIEPDNASALVRGARWAISRGTVAQDDASRWLERALEISKGSKATTAAAAAELGRLALESGDAGRAIAHFESALAAVPEANRLHYELAVLYRRAGNLERARWHLARRGRVGVRVPDLQVDALGELVVGADVPALEARSAFAAGDSRTAVNLFNRAIEADPTRLDLRINLAAALGQLGGPENIERALQQLDLVLATQPQNRGALINRAFLLEAAGEHERALAAYQAALAVAPGDSELERRLEALASSNR